MRDECLGPLAGGVDMAGAASRSSDSKPGPHRLARFETHGLSLVLTWKTYCEVSGLLKVRTTKTRTGRNGVGRLMGAE